MVHRYKPQRWQKFPRQRDNPHGSKEFFIPLENVASGVFTFFTFKGDDYLVKVDDSKPMHIVLAYAQVNARREGGRLVGYTGKEAKFGLLETLSGVYLKRKEGVKDGGSDERQ